jgi:hypothetical protein
MPPCQPQVPPPFASPSKLLSAFSAQHEPVPLLQNEDTLLSHFQDRLAVQIPFVVIPRATTAQELHTKRPFVYMTIMMIASYKDMATHSHLGKEILKYLAEHVIMRGEKNLDLLQGLLIYIFWFACQRYSISRRLTPS